MNIINNTHEVARLEQKLETALKEVDALRVELDFYRGWAADASNLLMYRDMSPAEDFGRIADELLSEYRES